jgi:hypothetical protein
VKVFNNTDRALLVERWTIFPQSTKCVNQLGKIREELPDEVAYSSVVQRLEALGVIKLPSFGKAKNVTPSEEPTRAPIPKTTPQEETVRSFDTSDYPRKRARSKGWGDKST